MSDLTIIGPLAYSGKPDCDSVMCRRAGIHQRDDGTWDYGECVGWHCSYCDEPTSYQGHNCDASQAILGEAKRIHQAGRPTPKKENRMTDPIERLREAVENEGPEPRYHREVMERHRREWPTLWAAIDDLLAASPGPEGRTTDG